MLPSFVNNSSARLDETKTHDFLILNGAQPFKLLTLRIKISAFRYLAYRLIVKIINSKRLQ